MRLLTSHDPVNMVRLGLDVVAAGVAFGLVVLVVFAIARIGTAGRSRPPAGTADHRRGTGGPQPTAAVPRARQVSAAWHIAGAPPGPAPRWCPGHRQRSRRSALRSAVRAEPDECVLTGRPARRAQGWSRARDARRPGHPGNPADRRTAASPGSASPGSVGAGSVGVGSVGRRMEPGPAVARPGRSQAAASRLPARHESGRSRPGALCPRRPAAASHAAP